MTCEQCGAPASMCACGEEPRSIQPQGLTLHWAHEDKPERVQFLVEDFIPAGCLVLVAGREGAGKSHFAQRLIAEASLGRLPGEFHGRPMRVLVMATEDAWHSRWIPRLHASGADLSRIARDPAVTVIDAEGREQLDLLSLSAPGSLDSLAQTMIAEDIRILYLDHLGEALKSGTNVNAYGEIAEALKQLNAWAKEHGITVIGGWHLSKGGGNVSDKVIGSVGLMTSARCVLLVAEDPRSGERLVALTKANDLDLDRPARSFTIKQADVVIEGERYGATLATPLVDAKHPGSGKEYVQQLIDDAANRDRPRDPKGNYLDADAWLQEYLVEHGPVMKSQVVAFAEVAGFSERTIERAYARLGGTSAKVGREAQWLLPTSTSATRDESGDDGG